MARKSKVTTSKTRVRHHVCRIAEYAAKEIDRYREHVACGRQTRERSLERQATKLPPEAHDYLQDDFAELDTVTRLADQLAIVALYRVVELITGRMIAHEFGRAAQQEASNIDNVASLLKNRKGIDLKAVPQYRAIDELRLLNNAIKHKGKVTKRLADAFPRWKDAELTGLDQAYDRLRPEVPAYIFQLAEQMKLKSK